MKNISVFVSLLLIFAVLFTACEQSETPESAAKELEQTLQKFFTSLLGGEMRTALDMVPDFLLTEFSENWNRDHLKDRDAIAQAYSGSDAERNVLSSQIRLVSCPVKSVYLKSADADAFAEQLEKVLHSVIKNHTKGMDAALFEAIAYTDVTLSQIGKNGQTEEISEEVACAKYDGKWYVLYVH